MEISPLTLQARPDVFQNKVVSLYKELFSVVREDICTMISADSDRMTIRRQQKDFGEFFSY